MLKKSIRKLLRKKVSTKRRSISKGGFFSSKDYIFYEENINYTITYYRFRTFHYKIQIDSQIYQHIHIDEIPPLNKAHIIKFIINHPDKLKLLTLKNILISNLNLNDIIPREIYDENLLNRYDIGDQIGQGGMGTVFVTKDDKYLVKKIIKERKDHMVLNILSEVNNYYKLITFNCNKSNKYFCEIIASYYDANQLFIVMEKCGTDLEKKINIFNDLNKRKFSYITNQNYLDGLSIFLNIAKAIQCIHDNNYVHLDIKPANVVCQEDDKIKLIDFGLSEFISRDFKLNNMTGTPGFVAPDLLRLENQDIKSADIYALGMILNILLIDEFDLDLLESFDRIPDKCEKYNRKTSSYYLFYLIENHFIIFKTDHTAHAQISMDVRDDTFKYYNMFITNIYYKSKVDPNLSDITSLAKRMISFEQKDRPVIKDVILELEQIIRNRSGL